MPLFRTAAENVAEVARRERFSTDSKNLDDLLSGGIELGSVTQFYGASNAGKTHLCHLLYAVLSLHYKVIYIDTQDGFSTAKVKSIAQARGLNSDNILKNVIVAKTYTTRKLEYCIESTQSKIKTERGVKLLIVDSMTHLYKTEFTERSQLPERQAKMSKYLHILLRLAHMNCVAVVITNQVHSNPNSNSEADKQNQ